MYNNTECVLSVRSIIILHLDMLEGWAGVPSLAYHSAMLSGQSFYTSGIATIKLYLKHIQSYPLLFYIIE